MQIEKSLKLFVGIDAFPPPVSCAITTFKIEMKFPTGQKCFLFIYLLIECRAFCCSAADDFLLSSSRRFSFILHQTISVSFHFPIFILL